MSTPQDHVQPSNLPAAIPWYKSAVFRGFLIAFFTQVIARVASKYHIDVAVLTEFGINADLLTQMALDGIATMAGAYALHARATKAMPAITVTRKQADVANAAAAVSVDSPTQEGK